MNDDIVGTIDSTSAKKNNHKAAEFQTNKINFHEMLFITACRVNRNVQKVRGLATARSRFYVEVKTSGNAQFSQSSLSN